jgi:hypothetical protein
MPTSKSKSQKSLNRYISLPAYDTYRIYVVAAANNLFTTAHITFTTNMVGVAEAART